MSTRSVITQTVQKWARGTLKASPTIGTIAPPDSENPSGVYITVNSKETWKECCASCWLNTQQAEARSLGGISRCQRDTKK